jgi:hypothetical protein
VEIAAMSTIRPIKNGPITDTYGGWRWYLNDKVHRVDGPAVEYADGDRFWYLNDKRHRIDGPAIEYAHGENQWYLNGKRHRIDGPAIEYPNGSYEWYLNEVRYSFEEYIVKANWSNEQIIMWKLLQ